MSVWFFGKAGIIRQTPATNLNPNSRVDEWLEEGTVYIYIERRAVRGFANRCTVAVATMNQRRKFGILSHTRADSLQQISQARRSTSRAPAVACRHRSRSQQSTWSFLVPLGNQVSNSLMTSLT